MMHVLLGLLLWILFIVLHHREVTGYRQTTTMMVERRRSSCHCRRDFFHQLTTAAFVGGSAFGFGGVPVSPAEAADDPAATATPNGTASGGDNKRSGVISSKFCASGVGEGCGEAAGDNEYIRMLQEKSAANREKYAQVSLLVFLLLLLII